MVTETVPTSGRAVSRQQRLADRVAALRTRASAGGLDRWLLWIGGTLLPLGILLIFLGWWGTSKTVYLFEQVPYLVSGGLLGLGLVFVGGFVYFAYWQTTIVRELRTERREVVAALRSIQATLEHGSVAASAEAVAAQPTGTFVATPTGTMYHKPDCPVVAKRDDVTLVDPQHTQLLPCGICDPVGQGADQLASEVLEN